MPIREVRCSNLDCGTLNRVPAYSIRKIPKCGRCGEPLPEQVAVKTLRGLYQSRRFFLRLAILASPLLFFAWIGSVPRITTPRPILAPTVSRVDSCAGSAQPSEGIYRWYGPMWGADIAELTIATARGSNYFIKLEDMSGRPVRAYFMHGGSTQSYPVPLGTFALKYATGQSWCGEDELFGDNTATSKAEDTFTFHDDTHWTVELILQPHGNLGTRSIPRSQF